jgi:hypothetical protein
MYHSMFGREHKTTVSGYAFVLPANRLSRIRKFKEPKCINCMEVAVPKRTFFWAMGVLLFARSAIKKGNVCWMFCCRFVFSFLVERKVDVLQNLDISRLWSLLLKSAMQRATCAVLN